MAGQAGRSGGRNRKATALHILEGTHRPDRHGDPDQELKPAAPSSLEPPPWLDEFAREAWAELTPELGRLGLLTVLDMPLFALSCQLYEKVRRAGGRKALTQRSRANGQVARPEVGQFVTGINALRQLWAEFGVTATARARLGVVDAEAPEDPAESFIGRKPRRQA